MKEKKRESGEAKSDSENNNLSRCNMKPKV